MSADRFSKNLWYLIAKLKTSSFPQIARFHFFRLKAWQDDLTHCAGTSLRWKNIPSQCIVCEGMVWSSLTKRLSTLSLCVICRKNRFDVWIQELVSRRKNPWLLKCAKLWNQTNLSGACFNYSKFGFGSIYSSLWRQHTCALNLSGPCFSIWLYRKNTDQAPALRLPQHNRLLPSHATMSCKIPLPDFQ